MAGPTPSEMTARSVVEADASGSCEDPAVGRARKELLNAQKRLARHLDGLEAGIPAEVISGRIAATRLRDRGGGATARCGDDRHERAERPLPASRAPSELPPVRRE